MGNLVQAIALNPKGRFVVVVPTHERRKRVFTQLLDLIRMHDRLNVVRWSGAGWEFTVAGGRERDSTVHVAIPNGPLNARRFDHVILDEVVNDPKDVWLQGVVMSRLVPGGQVEVAR